VTAAPPYAELHLHTAFSFLDGASLPEELVGRAAELGYRALAVTDHDGLHGAMEFARLARAAGIAPIVGAELTLTDGSHLTLLAATAAGYANLCRLVTAAHGGPLGDGPPGPELGDPTLGGDEWNAPPLPTSGGAGRSTRLPPRLGPRVQGRGGRRRAARRGRR